MRSKTLKACTKKTKRWWSFGIALEDFLLRLDTERVAFIQNLDNLLRSVDITDAEKQSLMRDPHCARWHDPHVQAELRRRITAQYYGWYISVLGDIREAILEINNCLPINKAYQVEAKSFENVMFKAKTSFFSRKDRLLQRIQNRNDDLSKFLLRESLQPKASPQNNILSGSGNGRIQSRPFLKLQKSSRELYGSLQAIWPCQCSSGHSCGVASTWDTSGQTPRHGALALLYGQPENNSCFELRIEEIESDCDGSSETSTKATFIQDLPDLRQNIANQNRAKKFKGKWVLRKLGQSSLSAFLNPARSRPDSSTTNTI
ncbi:hypothetical protein QBC43DRAFT_112712 [Cladorrhinum sp. PSN259]|nr:hypothetical protein QBC43DRAFT_112712 [Cladorrhinum sp. PSN259]